MAEENKKISFGFSKITKKSAIVVPKKEKNEIQFIDCLEANSIKLINAEEIKDNVLVIPLKNGNALKDNMIETLKTRKEEIKQKKQVTKEESTISEKESEKKPLTLDELAEKEILEDLKKANEAENIVDTRTILTGTNTVSDAKESTLEDYESIPVNEFGLAVLRGMGWSPGKGIGQNAQIVEPLDPFLRPKGMGLGADKVMPKVVTTSKEELIMKKGASVKIISGPYKLLYGKIEGFDELPGRIMVRLTLQNTVISISENLVQLVPSDEFNKQSKILNLNDFNKYKEEKESNNQLLDKVTDVKSQIQQHNQNKKNVSRYDSYNDRKEHKKSKDSSDESSETEDYHDKRKNYRRLDKKKHRSTSREGKEDKYKINSYYSKHKKSYKKERGRNSSISDDEKRRKEKRNQSSDSDYEYKKSLNIKKSSSSTRDKSRKNHYPKEKQKSRSKRSDSSNSSDSEVDRKHYKSSSKTSSYVYKKHSKSRNKSDSDSCSEQKESKHRKKKKRNRERYQSRSRSPPKHKYYSNK